MDCLSTNSSCAPKRRKGARSVLGCLTCRRRRVKCAAQKTPCDNCQRLNLACTPSFHANFKNWTPITAPNVGFEVPIATSQEGTPLDGNSGAKSGVIDAVQSHNVWTKELPQDVIFWLSNEIDNGDFTLQSGSAAGEEPAVERHEDGSSLEDGQLDDGWTVQTLNVTHSTFGGLVSSDNPFVSFNEDLLPHLGTSVDFTLHSSSINDSMMWEISKPMPQVYGN